MGTLDKMDERGWLVFTLFSFFTFVGISYVRESKLVFLVEKYSKQVESLQNVTVASKTDSLVGHTSGNPVNERVKIYKIPVSSTVLLDANIPSLGEMINGNY